ncbi:hypothetical protein HG530_002781 [Fusarium avenaceum]|nr:hypothetical protein HG530_002781 [Fusarium avenaceum]
MDDLSGDTVEHQVGRMTITQSKDVAHHRHDTKRACVVCSSLKPSLRRLGLEPQHAVQVLTCGVVQRITKHLNFLHQGEVVVVGRHLQHDAMLDVEQDLATLTVFPNKNVEGVAVGNPPQQTTILRQRDCRIALDVKMALEAFRVVRQQGIAEAEQLHNSFVLTNILVALEQEGVRLAVAAVDVELSWTLLRVNNAKRRVERHDLDDGLSALVCSWNSQVQVFGVEQFGRAVCQLQGGYLRKLPTYSAEYLIIQIPRLVQIVDVLARLVLTAPVLGLLEIPTKRLRERDLSKSLRTAF